MRDFKLRVFAASGACTSAGANTLTVNTKSNSVAFKRLISSIGTGCAILSPLRVTNRRPPSRGAATMGKSSLPSFTMRERIRRGHGFCRFSEDYLRQNVCFWHKADVPLALTNVCFEGKNGHYAGVRPFPLMTQSGRLGGKRTLNHARLAASSARSNSCPVDRCERKWRVRPSDSVANCVRWLGVEIVSGSNGARDVKAL